MSDLFSNDPIKILVCVKQVPDMESLFAVSADGKGYDERGLVFRMNSYDEFAVEEAVRIKESLKNVEITALSVGPKRAEAVVRRALEYGADHGAHIVIPDDARLDSLEIASLVASFTGGKSFDILIFGIMSEDDQRCQVGPMVAALLDLPCATTVVKETISEDRRHVVVERELEGGVRELVELTLPAAITVQSGINIPRYPSLSNKLRARDQKLEIIQASDLPSGRKCQDMVRIYTPPPAKGGIILEGTIERQADELIKILHEKARVL